MKQIAKMKGLHQEMKCECAKTWIRAWNDHSVSMAIIYIIYICKHCGKKVPALTTTACNCSSSTKHLPKKQKEKKEKKDSLTWPSILCIP